MDKSQLLTKSSGELRSLVREFKKNGHPDVGTGMEIAAAHKADCASVLVGNFATLAEAKAARTGDWQDALEIPMPNEAPAPRQPAPTQVGDVTAAAAMLAEALSGQQAGVSAEDVMQIVTDPANALMQKVTAEAERAIAELAPRRVEVTQPDGALVDAGIQHERFEDLIRILSCREHALLVGSAGTGKSHGALAASQALKLNFYSLSVGPMTSKSDLVGYKDAGGTYHPSALRNAYEKGGVFLLDEMDAGNAGVMTTLNAMLDGQQYDFPDKQIPRHADFLVVAAANTVGKGADRIFVGRVQLDGATLDRFVNMEWSYDTKLENQLLSAIAHPDKAAWLKRVEKVRANIDKHKVRHIAGFRSKRQGLNLLAKGFSLDKVEEMTLRKGLDETNWKRISV